MEHAVTTFPIPIPLVAVVLLMLMALVVVKVRVARLPRERDGRRPAADRRSASRGDLPPDPASALAALKGIADREGTP